MKIDNNEFIKYYLNLIGTLGATHNSIFWWASFTASKNRFVSNLRSSLYQLVTTGVYKPQPRKNAVLSALRFIIGTWIKIIIARWATSARFSQTIKPGTEYYVLRTWLYESSVDKYYHDSFFGILPDYLHKYKNLVVIAGCIGKYGKIAALTRRINEDYPIILQESLLTFHDPVYAVFKAWTNIPSIKTPFISNGVDLTPAIIEEVENDFKNNVPSQYLYYILTRRLAERIRIGTYTMTFENNPYERMQTLALRKFSPQTKIYGYQPLPLSDSALNMHLGSQEAEIVPTPNKIITIGDTTKDVLKEQGYKCEIVSGCGLRFSHKLPQKKTLESPITVLVTPEGGLSESVNLVNFVCSALQNEKQITVIIRSHPELPFEGYKHLLRFDIGSINNISLSNNQQLKDDLTISDVLIYRGSSSVLNAISSGLATVYIVFEDDIVSIDPVKNNRALKFNVGTEEELKKALSEISALPQEVYRIESKRARDFLGQYTKPVTLDALETFL